ncbi:serine/threonine/tyrosine-interacting protein, partial [Tremellales sp. Uapishka_1]
MRREAQLIDHGLYLGPFQASLNQQKMRDLGVTHILCIRDRKEASLIYPRFPESFRYMTLDISDNADQNIITIFPRCKEFIHHAISNGGTVLAHCNGGIALAPAIVVGYLMWNYGWSFDTTLSYVQSRRYCVSPMSFQIQLKEYEPIVIAQKMMEAQGYMGVPSGKKREGIEIDDDDDDDYKRKPPARPNYALPMKMDL